MADEKNTEAVESPVQVFDRDQVVLGQPQADREVVTIPHDGQTRVRETVVHTDKVILDPNHELAVQIPEGVGASTVDYGSPLGDALKAGTAEEQFAREREEDAPQAADKLGSPQADAEDKEKTETQSETTTENNDEKS